MSTKKAIKEEVAREELALASAPSAEPTPLDASFEIVHDSDELVVQTEDGEMIVDPETGEIISLKNLSTQLGTIEKLDPKSKDGAEALMKYLWTCGRAIRAIEKKTTLGLYSPLRVIETEIARLMEIRQTMLSRKEAAIDMMAANARAAMELAGAKNVNLDGIGRFRWRKIPDGLVDVPNADGETFDSLPDDVKLKLAEKLPVLFKTKTTVSPAKNDIKAALKNGTAVPYFTLEQKPEKFEFVPQKDE